MEPRRVVLLNDEAIACALGDLARRLGGQRKIALGVILRERISPAHRRSRPPGAARRLEPGPEARRRGRRPSTRRRNITRRSQCPPQIGRATLRERARQYVYNSRGAVYLKKNKARDDKRP